LLATPEYADPVKFKNETQPLLETVFQKFGQPLRDLSQSELGNNKAFSDFILNVGRMMKPDDFKGKGSGGDLPKPKEKTMDDVLKEQYPAMFPAEDKK